MLGRQDYWVWLSVLPNIGARKGRQLIDHFGDPENIWNANESELLHLHFLNHEDVMQILNPNVRIKVKEFTDKVSEAGIRVITLNDEIYPEYLKNIYNPPVVLFMRGKLLKNEKVVAVVGSRRATTYGQKMAEAISRDLALNGITVASGMARGIDSYAHKGALAAGGRTIAVTGCGLDMVYPYENKELALKIATNGALLSEYAPGVKPLSCNFPARNRIISGISLGVAVIEANERSGSLITVSFALEQGREVFAVPGNLTSMNSRGTNRLIKEGAKIITGVDDILEELNFYNSSLEASNVSNSRYNGNNLFNLVRGLDREERQIIKHLLEGETHLDELIQKSGLNAQILNSLLVMLELKGIVEQMPGKIFKITDS